MNVVLWIIAGLLAVAFAAAGAMKLAQPRAKLAASGMAWAEDSSDAGVKGIGALEVLGALGLVLPAALGVATVLTPLAALGLTLLMAGAVVVHVRRGESKAVGAPIVLGLLALVVAVLRFGAYSS
jgi:uncharacterized membrane protein YphA (DoxX/SURF4 family)